MTRQEYQNKGFTNFAWTTPFHCLNILECYSPDYKSLAFNYCSLLLSITACSEHYHCIFILQGVPPQLVLQNPLSCQNWELLFHLDDRQRGTGSITAAGHPCCGSPVLSSSKHSEPCCNNTASTSPGLK